ncbi:Armadillo repeat-containing protein 7 [Datura stramonium]|uniref:Armadillo repeat-containing protein 7 n=1 Tax=Datura stramonium TaxID=4076 RepID=A0ABS8USY4_DATST|nr:Armadillo repeat-containing protein 7 [Datura stramonium]
MRSLWNLGWRESAMLVLIQQMLLLSLSNDQYLSSSVFISPVRNTVNYALGALYYLCNASNKEVILKPEVIDAVKSYAAAGGVSTSFSNLAPGFLR